MIAIAFITFRESLEMLLVFGILLASLEQSKIHKKRDLFMGCAFGLLFSIILFIIVSFAGSKVHFNMGKQTSEIFENVNYLGSGIFLFITAILLHKKMKILTSGLPSLLLDTSLFLVGFLAVLREGIEIVVFSISASILSSFASSLLGFAIGLLLTFLVGVVGKRLAMTKLSHRKLLMAVDWGIKLLSLYFIIKGVVGLSEFII